MKATVLFMLNILGIISLCAQGTTVSPSFSSCTNTFEYTVCQAASSKDLSHFTIGLPACVASVDILEMRVNGEIYTGTNNSVHIDPTCGTYGLKWNVKTPKGSCTTFSYTTKSRFQISTVEFAGKAGLNCQIGSTTGPACQKCAAITGYVKIDTNNDDIGDTPMAGVILQLYSMPDNTFVAQTVTDLNGYYMFNDLSIGDYKVVETQPTGYDSVMDQDEEPDGDPLDGEVDTNDIVNIRLTDGETDIQNNFIEKLQVLPIELIKFKANSAQNGVQLNWVSGEEQNFSHFELYQSSNGKIFHKIAEIPGTGSGYLYSFTDNHAGTGNNYYYLRMVDSDASFSQSPITTANFKGFLRVNIFPNPVTEVLFIEGVDQESFISILDVTGKIIDRFKAVSGLNEVPMNQNKYKAGVYFIGYQLGGDLQYEKILITY